MKRKIHKRKYVKQLLRLLKRRLPKRKNKRNYIYTLQINLFSYENYKILAYEYKVYTINFVKFIRRHRYILNRIKKFRFKVILPKLVFSIIIVLNINKKYFIKLFYYTILNQ